MTQAAPNTAGPVRVGWIFSLVRCGSSAAAYAAAAPWGLGVADEPFGPWDRTGPPHEMPAVQRDLVRAFAAVGHTLSAEVVGLAGELFRLLAERDTAGSGRVICKCPHLLFDDQTFRSWFADTPGMLHRAVSLIRNPIGRLNSVYTRGWEALINDPFELEVYRTFAQRWSRAGSRVRFDELRRDPPGFFAELYRGFEFGAGPAEIEEAVRYAEGHYHGSSGQIEPSATSVLRSEAGWAVPVEVIEAYLADDQLRDFMAGQGWPVGRRSYVDPLARRLRRRLRVT
jgi:hypothetical protein